MSNVPDDRVPRKFYDRLVKAIAAIDGSPESFRRAAAEAEAVEHDFAAHELKKTGQERERDRGYFSALQLANPRARNMLQNLREASLIYKRRVIEALESGRPSMPWLRKSMESEHAYLELTHAILNERSRRKP